ncbi:MAG: DUF115 domain-containing protein, partial [Chlamydiae bacterium]|nr:DUF115 domain-containing protein [Chlamydiota bacterium]
MKEEMDQRIACLWGFDPGQGFSVEEKEVLFFTAREEAFWSGEPYIYYDGKNCDLESFAHLCKKRAFATLIHYISPDFSSEEVARAKEWIQRCQEIHWHACLVASEWQDFRIGIFRNLLANRTKLQDPVAWEGMKGLAKGVPAFICGAGPSLKQDKEWLTSCSQKGLVFAGGAALGFLTHAGFPVHIALGMDPDPNTKRVQMQGSFEAPFFFLGRFHRECLHAIHGALFQVPPNAESALEEWAEGRSWDVGWTVVTFACALAVHLGCNPVFLLGADFAALCEDSLYMEGVDGGGQKGVAFIGQGDKVLCTKKEWVIAARWIEDFIRQHQETTIYTTSSIEGPLQKIATGS